MTDLAGMQEWAAGVMTRAPDFIIGDNYLRRWWIVPRNPFCNVYLHEILRSDDDRALHDHPWTNTSIVLSGRYVEHMPFGLRQTREAGDIVTRQPTDAHRLEILPGERAVSLFMTGAKVREWGFHYPNSWTEFVDMSNLGQVGPGCGE